jgi:hypothetical protein
VPGARRQAHGTTDFGQVQDLADHGFVAGFNGPETTFRNGLSSLHRFA